MSIVDSAVAGTAEGKGLTVQRMTRQRQAVLAELERVDDFRSAQQIFEDLGTVGNRVGLATVYRNLQTLAEAGELDVLRAQDGENLYRMCAVHTHHHHLVCRRCGHTEDIEPGGLEAWLTSVAATHGYTAIEHSVEVFGLCASCTREAGDAEQVATH